ERMVSAAAGIFAVEPDAELRLVNVDGSDTGTLTGGRALESILDRLAVVTLRRRDDFTPRIPAGGGLVIVLLASGPAVTWAPSSPATAGPNRGSAGLLVFEFGADTGHRASRSPGSHEVPDGVGFPEVWDRVWSERGPR